MISFYKVPFKEYNNFLIEDFESFLPAYFLNVATGTMKYIKHGLNISVKINATQMALEYNKKNILVDSYYVFNKTNYVAIQNDDYDSYASGGNEYTNVVYYFIVNKTWKSQNCIELELLMDVLNTFAWNSTTTNGYKVNEKTLVLREHRDRLHKVITRYVRTIDYQSEEIYPSLIKNKQEKIIEPMNNNWILWYRNHNDYQSGDDPLIINNPVDTYFTAKHNFSLKGTDTGNTLNINDLTTGHTYYVFSYNDTTYNNTFDFFDENGVGRTQRVGKWFYFFKNASNQFVVKFGSVLLTSNQLQMENEETFTSSSLSFTPIVSLNCYESSSTLTPSYLYELFTGSTAKNKTFTLTSTLSSYELSEDNLPRTIPEMIKIIEYPYCPIPYEKQGTDYVLNSLVNYDATTKSFLLDDSLKDFANVFYHQGSMRPWEVIEMTFNTPTLIDPRNDYFESKIYHSDFYKPNFVYDSFVFTFKLEEADVNSIHYNEGLSNKWRIKFVASANLQSKFAFIFPNWKLNKSSENFDNVLVVARNNEQVVYNWQYVNYLRTGYNYDIKTKQRNEILGGSTLALSILGTIASTAFGASVAGPLGAVAGAVAGGISIATASISFAKSMAEQNQSIQKNLDSTKAQALSVQGVDDIDILNAFCDNKAYLMFYQPQDMMKNALLDMFYYAGYKTNERKVPSINTRTWFNFLQCELYILEDTNIPDDLIQAIKSRFQQGVTFFHAVTVLGVKTWNIAQDKENYETWLFN